MPFKSIYTLIKLCLLSGCFLSAAAHAQSPATAQNLRWHDARNLTVEGRGWTETKSFYDRLPSRAENTVRPPVWNLAQNSSGISVRFVTDSPEIYVRWKLRNQSLALPNMVATAHSGVDLYVKERGKWRWAGTGRADKPAVSESRIIGNMTRQKREFMLYLPLYNGVETIEIGHPENASLGKAAPVADGVKPLVFYGTSIVQGASASRPGLSYPAILSRRIDRPFINLGFSGNCKLETEIAALLAELDPSVYFIDCLPNLSPEEVAARAPKFIEILRRARPSTPIVLVENIVYPDAFLDEKKSAVVRSKNAEIKRVYQNLRRAGGRDFYYIPAGGLLGADGEATIDGIHPTDVGFERMADVFEPILRKILRRAQ